MMVLSKLITQVFDFKELADTITKTTTNVCYADSSWLMIEKEELELSSVNNIGYVDANKITNAILDCEKNGINELKIYQSQETLVGIREQLAGFKAVVAAPLKVHDSINGYLFVGRRHDYYFDEDDQNAISTFADYAALALENAKLIEESLEKERLEKEFDVAREIQYKILPRETPRINNLEISALFIPAFEVGGDYYDFFKLDDDKFGFVIADVSGKGISAAFIMAEVKGIFESLSKLVSNPKELLIRADNVLKSSLEKKTFVTATYGIINTKSGILNFARAGHTPLHLLRNGKSERMTPTGLGLGIDYIGKFDENLKEMEISLNNNDILILYTDGINEAKNENFEDFGYDRLDNIVRENADKPLDEIANSIMQEITVFSKNISQHDDITLVLLKWNNNKKVGEN